MRDAAGREPESIHEGGRGLNIFPETSRTLEHPACEADKVDTSQTRRGWFTVRNRLEDSNTPTFGPKPV